MEEDSESDGSMDELEDDVEEPVVDCLSEQGESFESDADILNTEAEVEDLGKRKGTNPARDDIIKKFRSTPPNANTSQGGFREVPISGMNPKTSSSSYKTYKVKKDPYLKEAKETMSKPVAVPLDQYVGLSLIASKDQNKLVRKLTSKAAAALASYADINHVEMACADNVAAPNSVAQTLYVPVLFPNCPEP